jgi:hypothetical protein
MDHKVTKLDDRKTVKVIESEKYGPIISCSDDDVYDALEDFINENYEMPFSVKHLNPGAELYFKTKTTKKTLNSILGDFFKNWHGV